MTYVSEVLADAPFNYWRLADPGGKVAYDLGSAGLALFARNYLGDLGYTGPLADGGSAFLTNNAAYWNVDPLIWSAPITLEAIFWQAQLAGREQKVISLELSPSYNGPSMGIAATGKAELTSGGTAIVAAAAFTTQVWHHMVGVFSATGRTMYVDAIQVLNDAVVMPTGNGTRSIGLRATDGLSYAEGFVAEVAIYKSVLSPSRINAHFLAINNVPSHPVYKPFGRTDFASGASTYNQADVSTILNSVHKVF